MGRRLLLAGAVLAVLGPVLLTLLTHRLGMSPARSGGGIAGFVGGIDPSGFTRRIFPRRLRVRSCEFDGWALSPITT